ncbi:MAG: extracellular solute-binding protein [Acidimicrobiales bacterium]|jgi:raffinose/stachyose/melibiose transport system substrate-binding protein
MSDNDSDITTTNPPGPSLTRRRFLALGAAGAAGTALVAASPSAASAAIRSSGITRVREPDAKTTLSFLSWDTIPVIQPVVDLFQKQNPSIGIEISHLQGPQPYVSTLATRLLAGVGPDIFIYTVENKTQLNKYNYVYDLSGQAFTKVMAANNLNFMSYNGGVWGLSVAAWAGGIYYNKALLAKVGSGPATTWDEFLTLCSKFKAMGITPYFGGGQPDVVVEALIGSHFKTAGLTDANIFDGKATFAEYWGPPLALYDKLYSSGLVPASMVGVSQTSGELQSEFANGKLATYGSGPWDEPTILADNPKLDFEMYPVPGATAASQRFWCGAPTEGWAINSKTKNLPGALKFLEFLASPEALKLYGSSSGQIITTNNVMTPVAPQLSLCATAARASTYYYTGIAWPAPIADALGNDANAQFELLVAGKTTPAKLEAYLQSAVKQLQG